MMTCYMCGEECEVYRKALVDSKDDTDRYLVVNSCKRGCPNWYDRDSACYEPEGIVNERLCDDRSLGVRDVSVLCVSDIEIGGINGRDGFQDS